MHGTGSSRRQALCFRGFGGPPGEPGARGVGEPMAAERVRNGVTNAVGGAAAESRRVLPVRRARRAWGPAGARAYRTRTAHAPSRVLSGPLGDPSGGDRRRLGGALRERVPALPPVSARLVAPLRPAGAAREDGIKGEKLAGTTCRRPAALQRAGAAGGLGGGNPAETRRTGPGAGARHPAA
ncbi:hypothetical protein SHJG_6189 [Streptomyces hygroscopicus subsp. jinggangensis 5008]|nr:hypothetical protein SHJG_6189 [Streptomyces hygroscopicus subsp. jinggangensis 5008]AGF65613.1 hypothetical protein SHJGH_5950 [Streptomyces hygroscopicus subsp. jinggangensis TL01]